MDYLSAVIGIVGLLISIVMLLVAVVIFAVGQKNTITRILTEVLEHIDKSDTHNGDCTTYQTDMTGKTDRFVTQVEELIKMGARMIKEQGEQKIVNNFMTNMHQESNRVLADVSGAIKELTVVLSTIKNGD